MSNNEQNDLAYVSSSCRLTMRSKKILDEIAEKCRQWDAEFPTKTVNNRVIEEKIQHTISPMRNKTPDKRRQTIKNSEFLNSISGSVKKRIAEIESRKHEITVNKPPPIRKIIYPTFLKEACNKTPEYKMPPFPVEQIPISCVLPINSQNHSINSKVNKIETESLKSKTSFSSNLELPEYPVEEEFKSDFSLIDLTKLDNEMGNIEINNDVNNKENEEPKEEDLDKSKMSESLTDISQLNQSSDEIGLFEEFERDALKLTYNIEPQKSSLKNSSSIKSKTHRTRRSLSFNDKVEIIEPEISDNDESEIETSSEINYDSMAFNPLIQSTLLENPISVINLRQDQINRTELLLLEEETNRNMQIKIELLRDQLTNPKVILGGSHHVTTCKELVETKLLLNTIYMQKANSSLKPSIIVGNLDIKDLSLGFKTGWIYVESNNRKLLENWNRLRSLYHILVCVYVEDRSHIFSSKIFTVISVSDSEKFNIDGENPNNMIIVDTVNLIGIQPKSRLIFDVFFMNVPTMNLVKSKKKANTPILKFFNRCSSVEKMMYDECKSMNSTDSPYSSRFCPQFNSPNCQQQYQPKPLAFTNIMTFEMGLCGVQESFVTYSDYLDVTKDCIITGEVCFRAKMQLYMTKSIEGKLNVYSDQNGVGNWSWYNCKLMPNGIEGTPCGGSCILTNDPRKRVFIPFSWCSSPAAACPTWVCPKPRTICVDIANTPKTRSQLSNTPINRRTSIDGKQKRRFLFEAASDEEQITWCQTINDALAAYHSFQD